MCEVFRLMGKKVGMKVGSGRPDPAYMASNWTASAHRNLAACARWSFAIPPSFGCLDALGTSYCRNKATSGIASVWHCLCGTR